MWEPESTQDTYRVVTAAVVAPLLARLHRRRKIALCLSAIGGVVMGAVSVLAYSRGVSMQLFPVFTIGFFGGAVIEALHARKIGTVQRMLNDGAHLVIEGENLTATLVETRCTAELNPDSIAALVAATEVVSKEDSRPATILEISSTLVAPLLTKVKRRRLLMLSVGAFGCLTIGAVTVLADVHIFGAWGFVLGIFFVVLVGGSIVLANAVRKVGKIGRMLQNGAQATLCGHDVTATLQATKCTIEIDPDHLVALLTDNSDRQLQEGERLLAQIEADDIASALADAIEIAELKAIIDDAQDEGDEGDDDDEDDDAAKAECA